MHFTPNGIFEIAAVLGTLGSLVFYAISACGIVSFLRARRWEQPSSFTPPVSILKPLKGIDPAMWESFCSHCEQDYPEYQLVFGVSDAADPAIELVHRLQQQYPQRDIQLVTCTKTLGTNTKVSTLAQMLPVARHEVLLVNDSDIRVPRDYLTKGVSPLADDSVGLATCLYRGISAATLGSRLESLGISTDFVPGVLSARFLEGGLRFGLGSTLAFRRADLAAIGGFEALADYLADDYELGRRIAQLGKRVELSSSVVETFLPAYSFREFIQHQLRWSRTIRDARRWGYVGLLFTFGLPWALAALLAGRGATWAWVLFAVTLALRLLVSLGSASVVLHDRQIWRDMILLPLRDLIAPVVWVLSFMGNEISWRGEKFYLKNGRLSRVSR